MSYKRSNNLAVRPLIILQRRKEMSEKKMLGSKEVAHKLGVEASHLRRVLRSLPEFKASGYTRYEFAENDPLLKKLPSILEEFGRRKSKKKDAEAKGKTAPKKKTAAASAKKKASTTPKKKKTTEKASEPAAAAPEPQASDSIFADEEEQSEAVSA